MSCAGSAPTRPYGICPAHRTKNGQPHLVPLAPAVQAILAAVPQDIGTRVHDNELNGRVRV